MGVPFGLLMGLGFAWRYGPWLGTVAGLACGASFGLAMAAFVERQRQRLHSVNAQFEGEPVVQEGPANHFLRGEGRGGWLTLTPSRLVFISHGKNLQNASLNLGLDQIASAAPALTAGVIPNGLRVHLNNGERESFVVSERKVWAQRISAAIEAKRNRASV